VTPTHKDVKRGERRAARAAKVKRTKKWLGRFVGAFGGSPGYDLDADANQLCDNPKWCQHEGCRNRRGREGPTLKERKQAASADAKIETWQEEFEEDHG